MHSIQNKNIKIAIKNIGAELSSIVSLKNNKEYLWRGDSEYWGGQAPILFPFVGRLKDDVFIANGKEYSHKKHGFFRKSNAVKLIEKTDTKLTFSITHSKETLKVYPYEFEFKTSYELIGNTVSIRHYIENLGTGCMYFSLGEHPAFNCSLNELNKSYEDCSLIFEKTENDVTWNINKEGLLDNTTTEILNNTNVIHLNQKSFEKDALVFKKLKSNKITLANKQEGILITVTFKDFPYLGIWSKPNAPFVCIEPWLGIADSQDSSQEIKKKEAIINLASKESFSATYSIEIHD
ncbi:aldose 1-epimerase family protein [Flavicella sp.]|uniref:aldose 1-epimerase family protein n=1 Tax=Flavicella sp. TaxID=2957742 RepID=UPI003019FFBB